MGSGPFAGPAYIGRVRAAFPGMTDEDTSLVGREEELSRLRDLVASPYAESRMLLVLGDPGMGKTVLLAETARGASSAGMRVLAAAGRESEQDLAFAGLHQLLRPVLDRVNSLPAVQAEALRGAFAISDDPVPPDALLTGIAVLTLLSGLSEQSPLLVVADDAQWLDPASLDALAFVVRAGIFDSEDKRVQDQPFHARHVLGKNVQDWRRLNNVA